MNAAAAFNVYLPDVALVAAALAPLGLLVAGAAAVGARRLIRRRGLEAGRFPGV